MPQVVAVAVKVYTVVKAYFAAHAVVAFFAKVALVAGSYAYQRQQTKKAMRALAGGSSNLDQSRSLTVKEAAATRKLIYGQMRVGGVLVFAQSTGTNKEYLHLVIVHASHQVEEIGDIYLNDEIVPLDGSGNATGKYAGYVTIKKHLGADSQTVDTDLQTAVGAGVWTNNHRLRGNAYSYVRLTANADLFPQGIPNVSAILKGRRVYDPRTTLTGWSANPALCLRDYLLLSADRGGFGAAAAEVDDAAVSAAANICDEAVSLNPSGTEARYEAHGVIDTAAEPGTVISGLCSAMAGICPFVGGVFKMKAGAHTASVLTIGEDDVRGAVSFQTRDSLRNAFNGVKGTMVSAKTDYQPADFPPVVNSTYTSEDGGERIWRDIALPYTTSTGCAQRLAKIELERSRQDIVINLRTSLMAIEAHVGDVVSVTLPRYGFSAKLFEVVSCRFIVEETKDGPVLALEWTLRETASGVWDWNNGEETQVDLAPNTTLVDPFSVPNVTGFAAAAAAGSERTAQPRVKLSWSAPANVAVTDGGFTELEYKKAADATWVPWNKVRGDILLEYVTDLEVGTSYNFRARHVNNRGVKSGAWVTATTTAPAGQSNYLANLTNDVHGVACDAEGTALSGELGVGGRASTDIQAWAGAAALAAVASAPGAGQFSITASVLSGTATITKVDADTVRVDTLSSNSAIIRVVVSVEGITTLNLDWTVFKNTSGGAYWLTADSAAVNKSLAGAYTPSAVTFRSYSKLQAAVGTSAYAGRFKIDTWNGSTWTNVYNSAADESVKAYTVPAGIVAFRCQLYLAGSFSTFLDEEVIPITSDGATGSTGATGATGATGPTGPAGANGSPGLGNTSGVGNASSTTWVDCCSITVTVAAGKTVYINATGSLSNATAAIRSGYMRFMRDSTQIGSDILKGNLPALTGLENWSFTGADTPGAGTFTYKAQVRTTGSGNDMYGNVDNLALL